MTKQPKLSLLLHGAKERAGITNEQIRDRTGIGINRVTTLLDYPELMTISNLISVARVLNVPAEEIRDNLTFK